MGLLKDLMESPTSIEREAAMRRADDLRDSLTGSSPDDIRRVFRLDGTETWRDIAARLTVAGEVVALLSERLEKLEGK